MYENSFQMGICICLHGFGIQRNLLSTGFVCFAWNHGPLFVCMESENIVFINGIGSSWFKWNLFFYFFGYGIVMHGE